MIVYWMLFIVFAALAMFEGSRELLTRDRIGPTAVLAAIALTLVIGYRYEVGGDWKNYLRIFTSIQYLSFSQLIQHGLDPGYGLLNVLSGWLGWGIIGVNVASAALFSWGLLVFCRQQPRPLLALLVAIPYLVIVVAMGYTRQGTAIGLCMLGLAALARKSHLGFVGWIILAATFHKTAMVLLPIAILAATEKRAWTATWIGGTSLAMYLLVLGDSVDGLVTNYVQSQMQSQGAAIRVFINAVPAVIFLLFRKRFPLRPAERKLWVWMSIFALGCVVFLFISPSSTAVDRMALYFMPLQLFVFSRLPDAFATMNIGPWVAKVGIVSYYASVQFVWLNFATHAFAWLPYKFYPLQPF